MKYYMARRHFAARYGIHPEIIGEGPTEHDAIFEGVFFLEIDAIALGFRELLERSGYPFGAPLELKWEFLRHWDCDLVEVEIAGG